jgi:hypothetical protein
MGSGFVPASLDILSTPAPSLYRVILGYFDFGTKLR